MTSGKRNTEPHFHIIKTEDEPPHVVLAHAEITIKRSEDGAIGIGAHVDWNETDESRRFELRKYLYCELVEAVYRVVDRAEATVTRTKDH